jgi:2-polyprenyl-6-methoxyphenol hydroxylase-like FAD-dependent oxidoreductase
MNVLISGGGLAGMTLAYWLKKYGFTPVIIEESPGLRRDGYGLDFFGTGYDVAQRMGLIDWLAARKIPAKSVSYVDAGGRLIAKLDMSRMERVMYGHYMPLMHWTLEEALYNAVKDDVEIRFGCTLQAVEQDADGVSVTFSDGSQARFDLLVGCDGIHSNTRRLVFGPERDFGHYMGYYVACYPLPDRYGIGHTWQNYTEPKRQVGAYCSDTDGELITFFMHEAPDEGHISMAERLPRLRRAFAGMDWITARLLDDIPDPDTIYMDTVTQIQMPSWHQGRVALVGDAAYCLTLISGQGASMALGGAYVLAQALRDHDDHEAAFRSYEAFMREPVESRQKGARDFAKAFVPGSRFGLFLQRLLFKIVLRPAFIGLLRRQFGAGSILPPA